MRGAKRNRIDPRRGEIERLATPTGRVVVVRERPPNHHHPPVVVRPAGSAPPAGLCPFEAGDLALRRGPGGGSPRRQRLGGVVPGGEDVPVAAVHVDEHVWGAGAWQHTRRDARLARLVAANQGFCGLLAARAAGPHGPGGRCGEAQDKHANYPRGHLVIVLLLALLLMLQPSQPKRELHSLPKVRIF